MKVLVLFGFIFLFGWLENSTKKLSGIPVSQKTITANDTIHFISKGEENTLIRSFVEQRSKE